VNVDHTPFTKVYDLLYTTVDDDHFIEFEVRRKAWGGEKHVVSSPESIISISSLIQLSVRYPLPKT